MTHTFTMQQLNELCSSPALDGIIKNLEEELQPDSAKHQTTPHKTTEFTLGDIAISSGLGYAMKCLALLPPRAQVMTIMPTVKRAAKHAAEKRLHDCVAALDKWADYPKWLADDRTGALVNPKMAEDDNIAYWPAYWALSAAAIVNVYESNPKVSADAVTHIVASSADAASETALTAALTYGTDNNARVAEMKLQLADIIKMHPPLHMKENAVNDVFASRTDHK